MTKSIFLQSYKTLTQQLIAARKDAKLTQVQMADLLGKPQSFVSKYENSERRLDVIEFVIVCQALKVDATFIINLINIDISESPIGKF